MLKNSVLENDPCTRSVGPSRSILCVCLHGGSHRAPRRDGCEGAGTRVRGGAAQGRSACPAALPSVNHLVSIPFTAAASGDSPATQVTVRLSRPCHMPLLSAGLQACELALAQAWGEGAPAEGLHPSPSRAERQAGRACSLMLSALYSPPPAPGPEAALGLPLTPHPLGHLSVPFRVIQSRLFQAQPIAKRSFPKAQASPVLTGCPSFTRERCGPPLPGRWGGRTSLSCSV